MGKYDEFADFYDRHMNAVSHAHMERVLPQLQLNPSMKILDVCSGPGSMTKFLISAAQKQGIEPLPDFTCVDIVPEMVQHIERWAVESRLSNHVKGVVSDAVNMSMLPDNTFDLVIMSLGLFDLSDPISGTREIFRLLKPTGSAVLFTWRESAMNTFCGDVKALMEGRQLPNLEGCPLDHCIWPNPGDTTDKLTGGGFERNNIRIWAQDLMQPFGHDLESFVAYFNSPFWIGAICPEQTGDDVPKRFEEAIRGAMTNDMRRTFSMSMNTWVTVAQK